MTTKKQKQIAEAADNGDQVISRAIERLAITSAVVKSLKEACQRTDGSGPALSPADIMCIAQGIEYAIDDVTASLLVHAVVCAAAGDRA